MILTEEQIKKIKGKYKGYQVFNSENIRGDSIKKDKEMPFVKVCHDYHYIEIYDKKDYDVKNFHENFEWGEPI